MINNLKKYFVFLLLIGIVGCSKHDPVLPGNRVDIFDDTKIRIENIDVPQLSETAKNIYGDENCDYRQDSTNTIWRENDKIFSGFATDSIVKSNQSPICDNGFIYTGLTTGEVIKINPVNKKIIWIADVFRASNMTGGASVVDIIARIGVDKNFIYAGGLGDAFCKINKTNGNKIWCLNISVPVDFVMVDDFAFVVGADNYLYAINTTNAKIHWKTEIKSQIKPVYENNLITIGNMRINSKDGRIINTGWF